MTEDPRIQVHQRHSTYNINCLHSEDQRMVKVQFPGTDAVIIILLHLLDFSASSPLMCYWYVKANINVTLCLVRCGLDV